MFYKKGSTESTEGAETSRQNVGGEVAEYSVEKVPFRFVKQAVSIPRKLTDAAVPQISHPAGNGVAGRKHAVLHFLRLHMEATLQEVLDWAEEMEQARAALALERGEFPGPSALCKSFDRHQCESGASSSDASRSYSTSLVTPQSTLPISTAIRHQLTILTAVIVRYRPSKRRFSSIPPIAW